MSVAEIIAQGRQRRAFDAVSPQYVSSQEVLGPRPSIFETMQKNRSRKLAEDLSISPSERMMEDARKPRGAVGHVFDLLSRGEYATASLANSLLNEDTPRLGAALLEALDESITPEKRLTFHDVIADKFPEFARENPVATGVLSFAASVALDPLNLLSFGSAGATRAISRATGEVIKLAPVGRLKNVFQKASVLPEFAGAFGGEAPATQKFITSLGFADDVDWSKTPRPRAWWRKAPKWEVRIPLNDGTYLTRRLPNQAHVDEAKAWIEAHGHDAAAMAKRFKLKDGRYWAGTSSENHVFVKPPKDPGRVGILADDASTPGFSLPIGNDGYESFVDAIADLADPSRTAGLARRKVAPRDTEAWKAANGRVGDSLRFNLAQTFEAAPGREHWGLVAFDGDALEIAMRRAKGRDQARVNEAFGRALPAKRFDLDTLDTLPLHGDVPVVAVVPPLHRVGDELAENVRFKDLTFYVGDSPNPVRGADLFAETRKVRDAAYRPVEEAVERGNEEIAHGIARLGRARTLKKEVLDKLGIDAEDLIDQGGIKLLGRTVASSERLRHYAEMSGVLRVGAALNRLPGAAQIRKGFDELHALVSRNKGVRLALTKAGVAADDIERVARLFENTRDQLEAQYLHGLKLIEAQAEEWGMSIADAAGERRVIDALLLAQDKTRKSIDAQLELDVAQGFPVPAGTLPPGAEGLAKFVPAAQAPQRRMLTAQTEGRLLEEAMTEVGAKRQERLAIMKFVSLRREMNENLAQAGLASVVMTNYAPVRWRLANPIKRMLATRRAVIDPEMARAGMVDNLTNGMGLRVPGEDKPFALAEHARAAGWVPEYDAVAMSALNLVENQQALLHAEYGAALKSLLPDGKLPDVLASDFFRILRHEPGLPFGRDVEAVRVFFKGFDAFQGWFKRTATIYNPAFLVRQLVGNTGQIMAGGGIRGFDPTAWSVSAHAHMRGEMPERIVDAFGRDIDLREEAKLLPILKNSAIEGIGLQNIDRSMARARTAVDAARALGKLGDGRLPEVEGMVGLLKRALPFTNWPGRLEDTMRTASYLSYRVAGNSPQEAFKMMERALFNYTTSMTKFEERVLARAIPFYRFNKFAMILTWNALTTKPGDTATLGKAARELGRAWGKIEALVFEKDRDTKPLTPAERHSLAGYLFEQPHAFVGVDPVLKEAAFRTFNGMSFLDWMSFLELDDLGNFDPDRTLVSGALGQLTPMLKVPLETFAGKEFFSDAVLNPDGRSIGDVDPDKLYAALGATLGAAMTGSMGGALAGLGGGMAADLIGRLGIDGVLRQITGWERAVDPRDGKEKVYINPYLLLVGTNIFPPLRTALVTSREEQHPAERVLRTIMGIGTVNVDMREAMIGQLRDRRREVDENVRRLRRLFQQGRGENALESDPMSDLQGSLRLIQDEAALMAGPIRGM